MAIAIAIAIAIAAAAIAMVMAVAMAVALALAMTMAMAIFEINLVASCTDCPRFHQIAQNDLLWVHILPPCAAHTGLHSIVEKDNAR